MAFVNESQSQSPVYINSQEWIFNGNEYLIRNITFSFIQALISQNPSKTESEIDLSTIDKTEIFQDWNSRN